MELVRASLRPINEGFQILVQHLAVTLKNLSPPILAKDRGGDELADDTRGDRGVVVAMACGVNEVGWTGEPADSQAGMGERLGETGSDDRRRVQIPEAGSS